MPRCVRLSSRRSVHRVFIIDLISRPQTLGSSEIEYLQQSLRILCGLYGVLKPLDEIRAYRLEMGLKFASNGKENLYAFWGERITEALSSEAAKAGCPFVLNVASQEYAKSVDFDELGVPVITAAFPGCDVAIRCWLACRVS